MSVRVAPKTEAVSRCVPRCDGGYLIITRKGNSAVSLVALPEGAPIFISDGKAVRANT